MTCPQCEIRDRKLEFLKKENARLKDNWNYIVGDVKNIICAAQSIFSCMKEELDCDVDKIIK